MNSLAFVNLMHKISSIFLLYTPVCQHEHRNDFFSMLRFHSLVFIMIYNVLTY